MTENELKLKTEEVVLRPTIGEQMCRKLDLVIHLLMDIRENTRSQEPASLHRNSGCNKA